MNYINALIKILKCARPAQNIFHNQEQSFNSAFDIVKIYYSIGLFIFASLLYYWQKGLELTELPTLWPVFWLNIVGINTGVSIIMIFFLVSSVLCAINIEKKIYRIIYFFSTFLFIAYINSFGKINHSLHGWLAVNFFFIFLPDGNRKKLVKTISAKHLYLTIFFSAQLIIMVFYSMAGFWKVIYGIHQLLNNENSIFSSNSLALQIANNILTKGQDTLLSTFIINYPTLGWIFYLTVIYFELFAFVAVFRPSLHKIWGIFLILFHIGSYLTLSVSFHFSVLIISILFICSPFAASGINIKNTLNDLPFIGWLINIMITKFRYINIRYI